MGANECNGERSSNREKKTINEAKNLSFGLNAIKYAISRKTGARIERERISKYPRIGSSHKKKTPRIHSERLGTLNVTVIVVRIEIGDLISYTQRGCLCFPSR